MKCRVFVDEYIKRQDLLEEKWFSTLDIMTYLGFSSDQLLEQITTGKIKVQKQTDGKLKLGVLVAYQYDDCPLADAGGRCLHFKAHNGKTISCLIEMKGIEKDHPNYKLLPSEDYVFNTENEIRKIIDCDRKLCFENQES